MDHSQFWRGIDLLAAHNGVSPSRLAVMAGLDPTAFNRSKRNDGRKPRWLSTESLGKVLRATGTSLEEFARSINSPTNKLRSSVPLIGLAQAGNGGFFDDSGFPAGHGWDQICLPCAKNENAYALTINGDSMEPVYRDGDRIIVTPNETIRKGDRIVVRTHEGEIMAKQLGSDDGQTLELVSFNLKYPVIWIPRSQIDWIARIAWVSQ